MLVNEPENDGPQQTEPHEIQRNLTWQIVEGYAAIKTVDKVLEVVVPDVYEATKGVVSKGLDKLKHDEPPPASADQSDD